MTNTKPMLTAVIITFNEAKNIADCIDSLWPVADEIVVVDSLSTDATKAICLNKGVRFIEQAFLGYVAQKNFAAQQAHGQYILSLDADERLSTDLQALILKEKAACFTQEAYIMNRYNNYCGQWIKHGDYFPDRKLRLWKQGIGEWVGDNPHDKFEPFKVLQPFLLQANLLHYSFRSYEEHIAQMNKFSTIVAQSLFNKGKQASNLKPWLSGTWAFVRCLIIKRGFLDGFNGYIIAKNNAFYTFYKYAKLNQLHKQAEANM